MELEKNATARVWKEKSDTVYTGSWDEEEVKK
jgi:hypothetical protein